MMVTLTLVVIMIVLKICQNCDNQTKVVFPDVIFSMGTYVGFQNIMDITDISVTFGHLYKYGKDLTFSNSVCSIPGAIIWKQRRHRIIHSSAHIIIQCILYDILSAVYIV